SWSGSRSCATVSAASPPPSCASASWKRPSSAASCFWDAGGARSAWPRPSWWTRRTRRRRRASSRRRWWRRPESRRLLRGSGEVDLDPGAQVTLHRGLRGAGQDLQRLVLAARGTEHEHGGAKHSGLLVEVGLNVASRPVELEEPACLHSLDPAPTIALRAAVARVSPREVGRVNRVGADRVGADRVVVVVGVMIAV